MKLVPQEDDTGCGAGVLAMVAGLSYREARDILHPKYTDRRKTWYTSWKKLEKALGDLDLLAGGRISNRKEPLWFRSLPPAVVRVKLPCHKRSQSHFVVWDGEAVYDPAEGGAIFDYLYKRPFRIISAIPVKIG